MKENRKKYTEILEKISDNSEYKEEYKALHELVNKHFDMLEHLEETSLLDVLEYEKRANKALIEPLRILTFENESLKKEVNKLRKEKNKSEKYKIIGK